MVGIKSLTIGYTKDIELAEQVARATGAKELIIETRPEGDTLMLNSEEKAQWSKRNWTLQGRTARKTLVADVVNDYPSNAVKEERKSEIQSGHVKEGYSEGGRLMASMLVKDGQFMPD